MMLPTHALAGMVLALAVAAVDPTFAGVALVAGLVGGVFPDLDLYAGHRKTLHYPVYYAALAAPAVAAAGVYPTVATVFAGVFLLSAAVHSVADAFGGGLELRPWEATSDRAVYDHFRGRWVAPRRWVGYDGSPRDLALAVALAAPLLATLEGPFRRVVLAALLVAVAYAAVRRRLPALAAPVVEGLIASLLPERLLPYVPARYREAGAAGAGDGGP